MGTSQVSTTEHNRRGEHIRAGNLFRHDDELCSLDISGGSDIPRGQSLKEAGKQGDWPRYEDGSCKDILAELDLSARSFDASPKKNPFHIFSEDSRTLTRNFFTLRSDDVPQWMAAVVMLCLGYKTYRLER